MTQFTACAGFFSASLKPLCGLVTLSFCSAFSLSAFASVPFQAAELSEKFEIAKCISEAPQETAVSLKLSIEAKSFANGQLSARKIILEGSMGSLQVADSFKVNGVVFNYDVEPGNDSYYGINQFEFFTDGDVASSYGASWTLSYVDGETFGKSSVMLSDAKYQALVGLSLKCEFKNQKSVLEKIGALR